MLTAHVPHFCKIISDINITHDSVHISGRHANGHEFAYETCGRMPDSPLPPKGFFFF